MKHTPGPWKIRQRGGGLTPQIWTGERGICRLDDAGRGLSLQTDANARLIAAAPELLEACQDALEALVWMLSANPEFAENAERLGMPDPLEDKLERAIAKATE